MKRNPAGRLARLSVVLAAAAAWAAAAGCTGRPLVRGLFDPGGTIYRDSEQEEWGARSTLTVRGMDF